MGSGHTDFETIAVMRGAHAGEQITLAVDALGRLRVLRINISDLAGVHGDLAGLDANDHPQYRLAGDIDHGALVGLSDYDHDQYIRKNLSQAITGAVLKRNVDDDLIQVHGGTGGGGSGADIRIYGANHPTLGGDIYVDVPNAAKDNPVLVLVVEGNTDTPVTDWQNRRLTNVADPTAARDAVTRQYFEGNIPVAEVDSSVTHGIHSSFPGLSESVGLSWTDLGRQGAETHVYSLAYLGNGVAVAGTYPNGKIYRSVDYGLTWTDLGRQGAETYVLSLAYLGNGVAVAGTTPTGKIFRSAVFLDGSSPRQIDCARDDAAGNPKVIAHRLGKIPTCVNCTALDSGLFVFVTAISATTITVGALWRDGSSPGSFSVYRAVFG